MTCPYCGGPARFVWWLGQRKKWVCYGQGNCGATFTR